MPPDFDLRLAALAEVVVRVGLNLQPGQPLLITDPYDLQGVHPEAESLVAAVRRAAHTDAVVLPADPVHLRTLGATDNLTAYDALVTAHTHRLQQHLARGGAFLFVTGTAPLNFSDLPADRLARFAAVKWRHLGPLIQHLVRGASQWTLVPAPTSEWAAAAGTGVPALWETVFQALRIDGWNPASKRIPSAAADPAPPCERWHTHLAGLTRRRDALNAARHRRIRYTGPGTNLSLGLARSHAWCTARLTTRAGVPFVANFPTEEVFTAPHKDSANGIVRVARPVAHNGSVMDGIELEFQAGCVTRARARSGEDLLHRLLATDPGACRVGEVALIPSLEGRSPTDRAPWQAAFPFSHHTLLDENASPHIALGDAYRFCSRAWFPFALNSSLLHLDLPLDGEVQLS